MHPHLCRGEELHVGERVIVAPTAGRFRPLAAEGAGHDADLLVVGQQIGVLDVPGRSRPVHSPFDGRLMGMLAHTGERVREGQPLAWLRVA
jgi:biotin carboxyl carrier protein